MRAFVVASSPQSSQPDARRPTSGDMVVAADGGANLCVAWGWPVHLVVGDMDSVTVAVADALKAQGVPFQSYPVEKDETDLEIALKAAVRAGPADIIIAGALGARIDHTLGNLALLALPVLVHVRTSIVDGGQTIWLVRDRLQVFGKPGDTLSIIPFGGDARGVSVSGVHWPLECADLPLGPSLGLSNRLTAECAEVEVTGGTVLAIHTRSEALT